MVNFKVIHNIGGINGTIFGKEIELKGNEVLIRKDEDKCKKKMNGFQNRTLMKF